MPRCGGRVTTYGTTLGRAAFTALSTHTGGMTRSNPSPALLAATLLAAVSPACATPDDAPWADASAVEGGTVPKLDAARLAGPMKLCGWWDNPTPGNAWLDDRSGQWTIALQGMYEAHGDWPEFKPGKQLPKGAPHGVGCACITARVDPASKYVWNFTGAQAGPLKVCLADPALKGRRPE